MIISPLALDDFYGIYCPKINHLCPQNDILCSGGTLSLTLIGVLDTSSVHCKLYCILVIICCLYQHI